MERALGHPLMTLNDVYEATWDDRYLRGAARLVDWAEKWEHPIHSGFLAPITEQPAFYSGSTFNGGLITVRAAEVQRLGETAGDRRHAGARGALAAHRNVEARGHHVEGRLAAPQRIARAHLEPHAAAAQRLSADARSAIPGRAARTDDGRFRATRRRDIKTRDTGLVFNYLPWFMQMLEEEGNPAPDPQFRITAKSALPQACFEMSNTGTTPITDLRATFPGASGFQVEAGGRARDAGARGDRPALLSGRSAAAINLTSQYNELSYAHCTASARRGGKPVLAHAWVKIELR